MAPDVALELADWRARVSQQYADVRTALGSVADPAAVHAAWRSARDELFCTHPQSPVAAGDRIRADGALPWWPYDPAYRFEVPLLPATADEREVDTGADGTLAMSRIGRVELPAPVGESLDVWWLEQYAGGLFVPLRDGTSGVESYGGGRYLLDTAKGSWLGGSVGSLVLDLNYAYHPSCRYDPAWQCPLAPAGNTIGTRIEAGERL